MSRIGKQSLSLPDGVAVALSDGVLTVTGPKGVLSRPVRDEIEFSVASDSVSLRPVSSSRLARNLWGTYASHMRNMVLGVTEGYRKQLEVHGVGYRAEMKGGALELRVGFSHPVLLSIPEGLEVEVKDAVITVSGMDKEAVGQFAAEVRRVRKPEPYKGKGIRYVGEVVRRKQGKKAA